MAVFDQAALERAIQGGAFGTAGAKLLGPGQRTMQEFANDPFGAPGWLVTPQGLAMKRGGTGPDTPAAYRPSYETDLSQYIQPSAPAPAAAPAPAPAPIDFTSIFDTQRNRLTQELLGRGYQQDAFAPLIDAELERIRGRIPANERNPSSYFGDNLADDIIGRETDRLRDFYGNQLASTFTPGFADTRLSSAADDQIIQDILGSQYNDALGVLDAQVARGNLNDSGYQSALTRLGDQRTTAEQRLQDIGGGYLAQGRQTLQDYGNRAVDTARNISFGQSFNPETYTSGLEQQTQDILGGLRGKISSSLGGQSLFDPQTAVNYGGAQQGSQNLASSIAAGKTSRDDKRSQSRGLGSTGAF